MPPLCSGLASRMCASAGMTELAVGALRGEVGCVVLGVPPSGAPDVLARPNVASWSASDVAVPDSMQHPDATRDHEAAAPHPRLVGLVAHPDVAVHQAGVLADECCGCRP